MGGEHPSGAEVVDGLMPQGTLQVGVGKGFPGRGVHIAQRRDYQPAVAKVGGGAQDRFARAVVYLRDDPHLAVRVNLPDRLLHRRLDLRGPGGSVLGVDVSGAVRGLVVKRALLELLPRGQIEHLAGVYPTGARGRHVNRLGHVALLVELLVALPQRVL